MIDRRSWLKGAAATGAGLTLFPNGASAARRLSPSDRVNIAVIGAGGMGAANMERLTSQNIVALADPDFSHVAKAFVDGKGQGICRMVEGLKGTAWIRLCPNERGCERAHEESDPCFGVFAY